MTRRKLPIGIQTFAKLREEGCCYVDNITDGAIARQMRDGLRDLYSIIKGRPMPTSTARVASRST